MESNRPESGSMQFGDDWPGLFLRGDNAMHYSQALRLALRELKEGNADQFMVISPLESLLSELRGTHAQAVDSGAVECQKLKPWKDCQL